MTPCSWDRGRSAPSRCCRVIPPVANQRHPVPSHEIAVMFQAAHLTGPPSSAKMLCGTHMTELKCSGIFKHFLTLLTTESSVYNFPVLQLGKLQQGINLAVARFLHGSHLGKRRGFNQRMLVWLREPKQGLRNDCVSGSSLVASNK